MMMIEVKILKYDDLPEELKEEYKHFTYHYFLMVYHNGELIFKESDYMEPEDAIFYRDLSWIPDIIKKAYKLGVKDGATMPEFFRRSWNKSDQRIKDEIKDEM